MASPHGPRDSGWGAYEASQHRQHPISIASDSQSQTGPGNLARATIEPPAPRPPPPPRSKAKNHRRRHVPVGPAGVWFQAQQQHLKENRNRVSKPRLIQDGNEGEEQEETGIEFTQDMPTKVAPSGVAFYSPAWISMQCDLQFVTPSLPAYLSESDRYTACRPHVPGHIHMIPEILAGQSDWKIAPDRRLLVLVDAIQSLADNLWVAELMDETGAKIYSWIQPRLVQQEQQRQLPKYIRPGFVWMLRDATILLVTKEQEEDSTSSFGMNSRMLLIGEQNIEQVWTPASGEEGISDEVYIRLMEQRNALTSSVNEASDIIQETVLLERDETREECVVDTSALARVEERTETETEEQGSLPTSFNRLGSRQTSLTVHDVNQENALDRSKDNPKRPDAPQNEAFASTATTVQSSVSNRFQQFAASVDSSGLALASPPTKKLVAASQQPRHMIHPSTQGTLDAGKTSSQEQNTVALEPALLPRPNSPTQSEKSPFASPDPTSSIAASTQKSSSSSSSRKKRKSRADRGVSPKRQKSPSNLWTCHGATILDLDDDEVAEDAVTGESALETAAHTEASESGANAHDSTTADEPAPSQTKPTATTLFQSSAFAAMGDLFDDEDDTF